jgi:methyl-accepting chemotaxis protein
MRSRGAIAATILALLVVAALVAAGALFEDINAYGVAAIVFAVAFGAAMLALMSLLLSLVGTVRELTHSLQQFTAETLPVLSGVSETVAGVNTELARVDGIVASVQHISGQAERVSDVVATAVANPLIKAIAFTTGTGAALRAVRRVRD